MNDKQESTMATIATLLVLFTTRTFDFNQILILNTFDSHNHKDW